MSRASGNYAWGICDRTGFRYPLKDLVYEYRNGTRTGFRVGRDVADPDHPQNFTGRVRSDDAQSLIDPRPDPRLGESLWGFNPVGHPMMVMVASVGRVTVEIGDNIATGFDMTNVSFDDTSNTFDEGS